MRGFSVDQKLKLVEQLHSRYNKNQYDLSRREQILYGKTSGKNYFYSEGSPYEEMPFPENGQNDYPVPNTFRLRILLALVLAMGLIVLDKNGGSFAGLSAGQIFETISADYEDALDAWLETDPLTADPGQLQPDPSIPLPSGTLPSAPQSSLLQP